jgi:hypothetical protein
MTRHFCKLNEMDPGLKRPCDAIALREESPRASGNEEIA